MKHTTSGIIAWPEAPSSASWPQQANIVNGKRSSRSKQSRYQPLMNPPKTHIAQHIHLEKYLPESSKQSRYKQGPLRCPLKFSLLAIVKVSEHKLGLFEHAQSMSKQPAGLVYIGNIINYLFFLPAPFPRGL